MPHGSPSRGSSVFTSAAIFGVEMRHIQRANHFVPLCPYFVVAPVLIIANAREVTGVYSVTSSLLSPVQVRISAFCEAACKIGCVWVPLPLSPGLRPPPSKSPAQLSIAFFARLISSFMPLM